MLKSSLRSNTALVLVAAGFMSFAPQASAQSTDKGAATAAASHPDEIIVTAQRRSERLIDTPQAITAVTSDDLSKLGATKFVDYANTVPGLQFNTQGIGRTQINLRGVTTGTDVSSTVGIYVDDVPYGSSTIFAIGQQLTLDAGLYDLDRIEVLRGPQGTLYGASSVGGLIKYVTRQPDLDEFGVTARGGLTTTRHGGTGYNADLVVNAPISTDKVAVRASAFYTREGGYVDNPQRGETNVDGGKVYGGRVDLLFKPTDDLSIRLSGYGQNVRRDGSLYVDYGLTTRRPTAGELDQAHPLQEPFRSNFRMASGTINYDFGGANLTSVTSYQHNRSKLLQDLSALYVPLLAGAIPLAAAGSYGDVETKKFTQEVRLASEANKTLEWVVGGFYTNEKAVLYQDIPIYDASGAQIPFILYQGTLPSRYREYAVFGDVTWHITDKFDITGGVRYARNKQRFEQNATGLLGVTLPVATSSGNAVTYLANARYHFSPNAMIYARFATGYRPGGPNTAVRDPNGQLLSPASFDSDTLYSYEVGFKGETSDRTFGIDLAAYYLDWKDIQIATSAQGVVQYLNAAGAHIKGAEVALTARPTRDLTIRGTAAFNDSELTEASTPLGGAKGERLPNSAGFTATVQADYTLTSSALQPTFGFTLRNVSERNSSFLANPGSPNYRLPAYALVDLRAGATLGPVEVQAFIRNLFDVRAQLSANTTTAAFGGPAAVAVSQPRTIGISATTRF